MNTKYLILAVSLLIISLGISCKRDRYKVDISSVKTDLTVDRLDEDLFSLDPADVSSAIPGLEKKYGEALRAFSYAINAGELSDSSFSTLLTEFCTDKLNNEVYGEVKLKFPDIEFIESGLEDAFRHYQYYFPSGKVPRVFTSVTGFNRSIITLAGEPVLGIGLDMYLGRDCRYYPGLGIYNYIMTRMNSYNIIPDCMYAWALKEWEFEEMHYQADNVFSRMIHEGKLKYFEKCMLPEIQDTLLFGFNDSQMTFCRNNETRMWQYLLEHDLLYSSDQMVILKLLGEGPFTGFFTTESPGRAGMWIGFRIVESYMIRNPDVTLEQLLVDPDYQGILEKARYNPQ